MSRKTENYDSEIINLRAFYLRLLSKLWVVVLAAVAGAAVGGLIYFLSNVVFAAPRNYYTDSTLYIYFAYDENKGTQVDWYNAYTWNTLIKTDDAIVGDVIKGLENAGYNGITKDVIAESVSADIPSDVRVMVLTVENPDLELTEAMTLAMNDALVNYGKNNTAFDQIKLLGRSEVKLRLLSDRICTAIILGAVAALIIAILAELILESMNDAVFIPEDAEKRYRIPVFGVITRDGQEEPSFFRNELLSAYEANMSSVMEAAVFCVDDRGGAELAVKNTDKLKAVLGSTVSERMKFVPLPLPGDNKDAEGSLKTVNGALIMITAGKRNGAMTAHLISQLKKMGCPVLGMILIDADKRFMERYLGL
jgi:capsular polysaccharide biosynthesis protein